MIKKGSELVVLPRFIFFQRKLRKPSHTCLYLHTKPMLKDLAHLLIDQSCYGCQRWLTQQETHVCLHCLGQMQPTDFHQSPTDNELYFRLAGRVPLHGATAQWFFDKKGRLQKIMQALKYQDAPHLGPVLGRQLALSLIDSDFIREVDAIVPVPLHWRKQLKRGYNQAKLIGDGLGERLSLPMRTDVLLRTQATQTQARKAGLSRWLNVQSAFVSPAPSPRSVLLIDDVITTGATLEACIKALMKGPTPPEEIRVASIGMTRRN